MLVERCNRCNRDIPYNNYKFEIKPDCISGSKWDELCTPDTRLDDFHLCYSCMKDFVNFIRENNA